MVWKVGSGGVKEKAKRRNKHKKQGIYSRPGRKLRACAAKEKEREGKVLRVLPSGR